MLTEVQQRWVDALRSGKYRQHNGELFRESDGYCCLGVGTQQYLDEHGLDWDDVDAEIDARSFHGEDKHLVEDVRKWLGLRTDNGAYLHYGHQSLADKNDNGATFAEIADIIESEPKGLFVNG